MVLAGGNFVGSRPNLRLFDAVGWVVGCEPQARTRFLAIWGGVRGKAAHPTRATLAHHGFQSIMLGMIL